MDFSEVDTLRWTDCIDRYFIMLFEKSNVGEILSLEFTETLGSIILEVAKKVAPKENWDVFFLGGTDPVVKSDKFEQGFQLGVWLDSFFFFDVPIHYPRHLYKMPDEFWKLFLDLHDYGKLEYKENVVTKVPSCIRSQSKNTSKRSLFRLVQNCVLFADQHDDFNDFGSIELMWPINIEKREFYSNLYGAFKRLYKMNYMLYREEYIRSRPKGKKK